MPIYEFKCEKCEKVFDDIVKYDTVSLPCPTCGEDSNKTFAVHKPNVSLKGGGWKNTGYEKVQAPPPVTYLPNGGCVVAKPIYGNSPKNK